jgi:copper chaperone CopZ/uncharacterized membrane protein YagU involved in acid resistance
MNKNLREEAIEIKGMHCVSCVARIEKKLSEMKGVDKARVSLVEEKGYVRFDPSQTNVNKIKSEIQNLGYRAGSDEKTSNVTSSKKLNNNSFKQGIIYGLLPHTGCIAFIVASIFGVTVATQLFKPLLLNPYFFHFLIALSFGFATVSAFVYLKRQGFINIGKYKDEFVFSFSPGIMKRKWKYLSTLYGTTIGINLLLFMIIFPLMANFSFPSITGAAVKAAVTDVTLSSLKLQVDIPCSGHAPLITQELKTLGGVSDVQFSFPNIFSIKYDSSQTTKQQILSLDVFNTYKATEISETQASSISQASNSQTNNVASTGTISGAGTAAEVINGVQTVQLSVQGTNYYPNPIVVKKDIPVRLVADVNNMPGCSKSIIIPEFNIRKTVTTGDNLIEFTPNKSGTFQFSCSMGMFRGQIVVQNADGSVSPSTGSVPISSGGTCGGGGGGCGCGG